MTNKPILVLGGTGKTGRRVVKQLGERGLPVRVASRSGQQTFDWYDERTWSPAVAGVDTAYLAPPVGPTGLALAGQFVQQAVKDGLRRVVLLSGRGVGSPGREFAVYESGLELEHAVQDSRADWTIVQPSWFAQNFSEDFLYDGVLAGEVRLSAGRGAEAFIDVDDLAEVITAALTDEEHTGRVYPLSGPQALTFEQATSEISAAIGRPVSYIELEPEQHVAELVAYGVSLEDAQAVRDLFAVVRNGRSNYVSDGVQQVLDREPRDFRTWAKATAATGAWSA